MSTLPPDQSFGHVLRDVNRMFQKALGERIAQHGVMLGHWYVLRVLWIEDGLTQADIAHRSGISAPTAVTALRGLEERGIVRRKDHATDHRKKLVYLTTKGRALEDICLQEAMAVNETALRTSHAEEIAAALDLLRKAQRNLAAPQSLQDQGN